MTSGEQLELLRSAVALRVEGRSVSERVRRELARVETTLIGVVGPLVRKRVAARLLGVSVQALDRWVTKGRVPVESVEDGSRRMAIPTQALVAIAYELELLPEERRRLSRAVANWHIRTMREQEFRSVSNLTAFGLRIARLMREQHT